MFFGDGVADIADDGQRGVLHEGVDFCGVGNGEQEHVGFVDGLPAADIRPVDADAVFKDVFVEGFDGDVSIGFWSKDGKTVYFTEGIKATNQLLALDLDKNAVRQVSNVRASLDMNQDDDSKLLILNYADPHTASTLFTVASVDQVPARAEWRQLTDPNPQIRSFALGDEVCHEDDAVVSGSALCRANCIRDGPPDDSAGERIAQG